METIKLKILDEAGHTLMTCDALVLRQSFYSESDKPHRHICGKVWQHHP